MKKTLVAVSVATMVVALAQTTLAGDAGRFGIGIQGGTATTSGDGDALGISLRYAPKPLGGAIVFSQSYDNERDTDGDQKSFAVDFKGFYSFIQRENSDFYAGASIGVLRTEDNGDDSNYPTLGVLLGTEFYFTELPEVGFNFEVGYRGTWESDEGDNSDILGTYVSAGVHYYF